MARFAVYVDYFYPRQLKVYNIYNLVFVVKYSAKLY